MRGLVLACLVPVLVAGSGWAEPSPRAPVGSGTSTTLPPLPKRPSQEERAPAVPPPTTTTTRPHHHHRR